MTSDRKRRDREKQRGYDRNSYRKHRSERIARRIRWRKEHPVQTAEYISKTRYQRAAAMRRYAAKKGGFAECVEYPPPRTDSKCSICHREAPLALDHDHETGKFRGYICRSCNLGLGQLGDTVEAIRRVLAYLERADG
jgi:hypothetical protein